MEHDQEEGLETKNEEFENKGSTIKRKNGRDKPREKNP